MAKWRPVDVRLWNDRKVASLSDRGKLLWVYLLTSPFMLPIPGVIIAGEMAIAEHLGWQPEGVAEGFAEIIHKKLWISRYERLIWLRKALLYQPIQGPNHIRAIAKTWDDVPDCSFKIEIWQELKIACKGWSILFAKGVREPVVKGVSEGVQEGVADPFHTGTRTGTVSGTGSGIGTGTGIGTTPDSDSTNPPKQNARARKAPALRLPADWTPRPEEIAKATALGLVPADELEHFRDHHTAKGSTMVDWNAAFRTWLGNAQRFANGTQNGHGRKPAARRDPLLQTLLDDIARREAAGET